MNATVIIPIQLRGGPNARLHWSQRARVAKRERRAAWVATTGWRLAADDGAIVTLTRLAPRRLDDDNLRGALKAVRDGVADRLGVRDNDPRVRWRYGQESAGVGFHGVRIELAAYPGAQNPWPADEE